MPGARPFRSVNARRFNLETSQKQVESVQRGTFIKRLKKNLRH